MKGRTDRARIIAPPPLLGVVCIAAGFVADHFKRLPLFAGKGALSVVIGAGLLAFGIFVIVHARRCFIAAGAHPNPYRPTAAVVTTGAYQFSRNPIYVAFLLIVAAFALLDNSAWFLASTVLLFFLLHFGVVKREEQYLSEKFGAAYNSYLERVRRWI